MDNIGNKLTVLEEIVSDVSTKLFEKWSAALPLDQKTDLGLASLKRNAVETTYFVIQLFMNKFNEAAEELKTVDEPKDI